MARRMRTDGERAGLAAAAIRLPLVTAALAAMRGQAEAVEVAAGQRIAAIRLITPEPEATVETVSFVSSSGANGMAQSFAIVRDSDGLVETFVRLDLPLGWSPPDGFSAVPDDELPDGWQMIPVPASPLTDLIA